MHTHTCIHTHTQIHTYRHPHAPPPLSSPLLIHIYTHTYIHTYKHPLTHTHTHTHFKSRQGLGRYKSAKQKQHSPPKHIQQKSNLHLEHCCNTQTETRSCQQHRFISPTQKSEIHVSNTQHKNRFMLHVNTETDSCQQRRNRFM